MDIEFNLLLEKEEKEKFIQSRAEHFKCIM